MQVFIQLCDSYNNNNSNNRNKNLYSAIFLSSMALCNNRSS